MKIDFFPRGLKKYDFCGLPKKPLVARVFIIIYDMYLIRFKVFTKFHDLQAFLGNPWGKNCQNFQKDNQYSLFIVSL